MHISNNSIGSVHYRQNTIQLNMVCTPVSVAIYFYRNNERGTVALFSPSDVVAGQSREAVRLSPHSQKQKNKISGQFHGHENGI